jgi:hypothetical protein
MRYSKNVFPAYDTTLQKSPISQGGPSPYSAFVSSLHCIVIRVQNHPMYNVLTATRAPSENLAKLLAWATS